MKSPHVTVSAAVSARLLRLSSSRVMVMSAGRRQRHRRCRRAARRRGLMRWLAWGKPEVRSQRSEIGM